MYHVPFSIDGTFPHMQAATFIGTCAPPIPSEMQAFELIADNKLVLLLYVHMYSSLNVPMLEFCHDFHDRIICF